MKIKILLSLLSLVSVVSATSAYAFELSLPAGFEKYTDCVVEIDSASPVVVKGACNSGKEFVLLQNDATATVLEAKQVVFQTFSQHKFYNMGIESNANSTTFHFARNLDKEAYDAWKAKQDAFLNGFLGGFGG